REEFTRDMLSMVAGVVAKPVLARLGGRVDNRQYNGAALLGLRGVVIKSHGSADALAFGYALQRARDAVRNGLLDGTTRAISVSKKACNKLSWNSSCHWPPGQNQRPSGILLAPRCFRKFNDAFRQNYRYRCVFAPQCSV